MRSLSPNKKCSLRRLADNYIRNGITEVASVCRIGAEDVGNDGFFPATKDEKAISNALVNSRDVWGRNAVENLDIAT